MTGGKARNRRKQRQWRNAYRLAQTRRLLANCLKCGEPGAAHFVPPSFGDPGFFMCTEMLDNGKVVAVELEPQDHRPSKKEDQS